jgi:cell division protein FtsB
MIAKKYIGRIFFGIEVAIFAGLYCFGGNGIMAIVQLKNEIVVSQKHNALLQNEVMILKRTVVLQQKNPFFQEKFAREQLHMAREQEEIIYL